MKENKLEIVPLPFHFEFPLKYQSDRKGVKMTRRSKGKTFPVFFFLLARFVATCASFKHAMSQVDSNPKFGCFPIIQHKILDNVNSNPQCNVTFLNENENPHPPKCVRRGKNVFQIIGNFSVLSLNCTAPYLLNLDFDGFRPTEALNVFLWRDLVEITDEANVNKTHGIKVKSFGLNATITSIQTLFEQYKNYMRMNEAEERPLTFLQRNLSSPIRYPRTGRIRIRGMQQAHKNKLQDVYFFFEEPSLEKELSFMENEHTLQAIYISEFVERSNSTESFILIPCRPSHWTTNVSLSFKNRSAAGQGQYTGWSDLSPNLVTSIFDPTIGFKIPAQVIGIGSQSKGSDRLNAETLETEFQCSAISENGKRIIWEANSNVGHLEFHNGVPVYGVHLLPKRPLEPNEPISITFGPALFDRDRYVTSLRCSFDQPQPHASLTSLGFRQQSFTEFNFARELALPVFANRSYFVVEGKTPRDGATGFDLLVDPARGNGVACCATGEDFEFVEYITSPFIGSKYTFPAGSFQPHLPIHAVPDYVLIRVEQHWPRSTSSIYTYETAEFLCNTLNSYSMNRKPVLWFSQNSQGARKLIFKDEFISDDPLRVNDNSRLKIQLTKDITKIICMGALWQTDTWRHSAIDVHVTDGAPPSFVGSKDRFNFPRNSLNQTISCLAGGDPLPQVWLERDGVKLGKTNSTGVKTALYKIGKVDESSVGKYKCIAQNPYGRIEMDFLVEFNEANPVFYLLAVGLPLLIFFAVVVAVFLLYSRAQLRKEILTAEELQDFREGKDTSQLDQEKYSPAMAIPYTEEFEIPHGKFSIHRDEVLGCGEFGMVMKATVQNRQVAVKTVKPDCEKIHFKSLIMELKILMYLGKHPHLIEFVGAYTKNIQRGLVYIFVELCEGGNLLSFLQKNRRNYTENYQNVDGLTVDVLHEWAFQIAEGMKYLGSRRIIHGDLAARNVLLTEDRIAKITDFGLSRQLMSYSTYMKQSEEPLPFRWMSLESLESLKFSCESDVWSFGVLLWEIYSLGQIPFPDLSWDIEFVESLRNGLRMPCPHTISHQLFASLLYPCWENDGKMRPSFESICSILDQLRKNAPSAEY